MHLYGVFRHTLDRFIVQSKKLILPPFPFVWCDLRYMLIKIGKIVGFRDGSMLDGGRRRIARVGIWQLFPVSGFSRYTMGNGAGGSALNI